MSIPTNQLHYTIHGTDTQCVEIELDPGQSILAEAGSILCMDSGIQMKTILGDGSHQKGGMFKTLVGAGKRLMSGEGVFVTVFTNESNGKQRVTFTSPYPGKIISLNVSQHGGTIICQKDAFLCAAKGIAVGMAFQQRILPNIFGKAGFILQKLEGNGLACLHASGNVFEKQLAAGQSLHVDISCVIALQSSISYEIQNVRGAKNAFFGDEGIPLLHLTGPGKIWLQSTPFLHLTAQIVEKVTSNTQTVTKKQ